MHLVTDHQMVPVTAPVPAPRPAAPPLLVDLIETACRTPFWSSRQMILRNVAQDLAPGMRFPGLFQFDGAQGWGLFEAVVTRSESARQMIGAEFCWVSLQGRALMTAFEGRRQRDPLGRGPQMAVSLSRPTVAWSTAGLVVAGSHALVGAGERVHGLLRHDKAQEPAPFTAMVIGQVAETATSRPALALKFAELPAATAALLEAAARQRAVAA